VHGVELEVLRGGAGEQILLLHDIEYLNQARHFLELLAEDFVVLVPSHPGFGTSDLPTGFDSVDDLAYFYLDLLEDIGPAHVIGLGFGGWIAAEMAVRCPHDLRSLVLVDAVGIKPSGRETVDIADTFVMDPREFIRQTWHDPAIGEQTMKLPGFSQLDEVELTLLLRNRESGALYGWNPFMHDPKLLSRLHRIIVPTLVLWGESDRIVSADYGRSFASSIPGARFQTLEAAGHYPYLEQSERFVAAIAAFIKKL
jgi:pimeloyl-ACP methyl ester carboxylesterase